MLCARIRVWESMFSVPRPNSSAMSHRCLPRNYATCCIFFNAVCISSTCSENMSLNRTCCCITQLVAASYQLKVTSCNNCAHATDSNLAICWGKTCGNMNLIYIKVMWTLGRIEYAEFA